MPPACGAIAGGTKRTLILQYDLSPAHAAKFDRDDTAGEAGVSVPVPAHPCRRMTAARIAVATPGRAGEGGSILRWL